MKKTSVYLMALLLAVSFMLVGCTAGKGGNSSAEQEGSLLTPDTAGAVVLSGNTQLYPEVSPFGQPDIDGSEASGTVTVPPGQYPPINGRFNENGWLKVISDNKAIIPYEHDIPGQELYSWGELGAEGAPLNIYLLDIYAELPVIDRSKGFELDVYEWACIYLIDVFDASFNRIAHRIDTAELFQLIEDSSGELIIEIQLYVPGCEIFEEPVERQGRGYAFILSAADPNAEAAATGHEPFLRLYSYGEEVGTHEVFMYGASAYYEDGVAKGMLCADGMAFFDPDHIAGAFEGLPVYSGCRAEGLDIRLSEGAEIRQIYVYDPANGFERTAVADLSELYRLIADSAGSGLAVEIVAYRQGDFIEELNAYEYAAYAYAFVVK